MKIYDFKMNLLGNIINVSGLGSVAVDLLFKKEKKALDIVRYFIFDAVDKEKSMVILYPFRCDFYKNMGFGFGTKLYKYKLFPHQIKNFKDKGNVKYLNIDYLEEFEKFYNGFVKIKNGMIQRPKYYIENMLKDNSICKIGVFDNNILKGYMFFSFEDLNPHCIDNKLSVKEIVYNDLKTLKNMLAFLKTQYDQFKTIEINSFDENLYFMFNNPEFMEKEMEFPLSKLVSKKYIGMMYRIVNIKKLFKELSGTNFNNESLILKITIDDNLVESNNKSHIIKFENGKPDYIEKGKYDVEIKLNISEFSSLIINSISFKSLVKYGLIEISDEKYLDKLDKMFKIEESPECYTTF
jgi:predicted acetyltransferase